MEIIILRDADYGDTLALQRAEFESRVQCRKSGKALPEDIVVFAEHRPVYTLGRHGDPDNLLLSEEMLGGLGVSLYRIDRGGDITYHGPGQITVYPVIDLERYRLGVKDYVRLLEEAVIRTIEEYGIRGERVDGATGVWIEPETPQARKISAIGIRCSRHVSMHGLALNVGSDLSGFERINPCGFKDKGVTSVSRETGSEVEWSEVRERLEYQFKRLLLPRIPSQGIS